MAVTRLKRKAKRNKSRASARQAKIKRLSSKPVIESVDVEAIKEEFDAKAGKGKAKAAKKEEKAPAKEKKAEKEEEKEESAE